MAASRSAAVPFTARDWLLLISVALMWGSSFLLIKIGLEDFPPTTVAWLRIAFGALTLALLPGARAPLRNRGDWRLVALLGLVWMAVPFTLLALAEQHISSALAGMINGAAPLFTTLFAALWFREAPSGRMLFGLGVGFAGVVTIGLPNVDGAASVAGILMIVGATVLYGVAFNLSGPLQRRNGALPVIWRAQLIALVVTTPFGAPGLAQSTPTVPGLVAMIALGALGTGVAFAFFTTLVGRVGGPRGSVTTYVVPVIALLLGAGLAGESVAPCRWPGSRWCSSAPTSQPPRGASRGRHDRRRPTSTRLPPARPDQAGDGSGSFGGHGPKPWGAAGNTARCGPWLSRGGHGMLALRCAPPMVGRTSTATSRLSAFPRWLRP